MEMKMSAQYPVVPVAAGTLVRVFAELMLPVVKVLKTVERALRHRREANVLARLDRHMLADIGLTRSDVQDAFSSPLWEDPTELLSERARERRIGRLAVRTSAHRCPATKTFRSLRTGAHCPCSENYFDFRMI
jgi:uncharacterized protein YjiS (DUF1127 family)